MPIYQQAVVQLRLTVERDPSSFEPQFNLASIEFWLWQLGVQNAEAVRPLLEQALATYRGLAATGHAERLERELGG